MFKYFLIFFLICSKLVLCNSEEIDKVIDDGKINLLKKYSKCLENWSYERVALYQMQNEFLDPKICGSRLRVDAKGYELVKGAIRGKLIKSRFKMYARDLAVIKYNGFEISYVFGDEGIEAAGVVIRD
jgi:hypothetical protein